MLICSSFVFSQSDIVYGLVVEKGSKKPVSFASVYYENTTDGTISNTDGRFSIKKSAKSNNLIISSLGYKTKIINKSEIINDTLRIVLETEVFELSEIIVTSETALSILKKVVLFKTKNNPVNPTIINAYYKQVSKQNGKYIRFSEADLSVYRTSYLRKKKII